MSVLIAANVLVTAVRFFLLRQWIDRGVLVTPNPTTVPERLSQ